MLVLWPDKSDTAVKSFNPSKCGIAGEKSYEQHSGIAKFNIKQRFNFIPEPLSRRYSNILQITTYNAVVHHPSVSSS
jgi:hypothetical protein